MSMKLTYDSWVPIIKVFSSLGITLRVVNYNCVVFMRSSACLFLCKGWRLTFRRVWIALSMFEALGRMEVYIYSLEILTWFM